MLFIGTVYHIGMVVKAESVAVPPCEIIIDRKYTDRHANDAMAAEPIGTDCVPSGSAHRHSLFIMLGKWNGKLRAEC